MRRTNQKPYWYIKEDRHDEQRWLRQNRRTWRRLHLDYGTIRLCRPRVRRTPTWKQFEGFREAMKEAVRDFPEFFQREQACERNINEINERELQASESADASAVSSDGNIIMPSANQ